jgi:hypothetical protein
MRCFWTRVYSDAVSRLRWHRLRRSGYWKSVLVWRGDYGRDVLLGAQRRRATWYERLSERGDPSTSRSLRGQRSVACCVFRPKWCTDSGASGPPVPGQVVHSFRRMWSSDSGHVILPFRHMWSTPGAGAKRTLDNLLPKPSVARFPSESNREVEWRHRGCPCAGSKKSFG